MACAPGSPARCRRRRPGRPSGCCPRSTVARASVAACSRWCVPSAVPGQQARGVGERGGAALPSRSWRCRMLRSALSAVRPSRSAGAASEALCSVRKVARSASVPEVSSTASVVPCRTVVPSRPGPGSSGSRSAACRCRCRRRSWCRSVRVAGVVVGGVRRAGGASGRLGRAARPPRRWRGSSWRRRAAACRPCRGRSRRRTRAPWPAWRPGASSSRTATFERDSTRSWMDSRSIVLPEREARVLDEAEQRGLHDRLRRARAAGPGCRSARRAGAPTGSARRAGSRPAASLPPRRSTRAISGSARRGRTSGTPAPHDHVHRAVGQRDLLGGGDDRRTSGRRGPSTSSIAGSGSVA